jgi:hypothetical protein
VILRPSLRRIGRLYSPNSNCASVSPLWLPRDDRRSLRNGAARLPLAYTLGDNLVKTIWNQGYPYNKFLPAVGGQTVAAGCVNVALAQVMRYHDYPASAKGVVSYTWTPPAPQSSEVLKTILYRNYNWANMPATIDATTPEYQIDEVALLLRDLGIANRTAFDPLGSSTVLDTRMVIENFGYSTGLSKMDNTNYDGFLATLKAEIDAAQPVLLTFPGHMVVADGYRTEGLGESVHINMGWGGAADNFYFLNAPVTAGGYEFAIDAGKLNIYFMIKPCNTEAGDCAVNLEPGDGIDGLAITGAFNREKDTDLYPVYLKGQTTISGTRNYDNLAFYIFIVKPADGSIVYQVPDPGTTGSGGAVFSAGNLPAGKYGVRVSLCNENGTYCYDPNPNSPYAVTLTSDLLTAEEKIAADQALDKPPVIGNAFPDMILNTTAGTRKLLIDARDENGDTIQLQITNSNPAAVTAAPLTGNILTRNILDLTPTGTAKVASRITVTASANGKTAEKSFTVMTDSGDTGFGRSFTIGGTFAGQQDVQIHEVILDGRCTVIGGRPGISNQAFFSYVYDATDELLASADGASVPDNESLLGHSLIDDIFPQGIYRLKVAICKNGSCYPSTVGDTYTLTVSCPAADESTTAIAGLLGINLSGSVSWGDVNGDYKVNLADAILTLQILSRMDTSVKTISLRADVTADVRIGLAEMIFILQKTAGLRN